MTTESQAKSAATSDTTADTLTLRPMIADDLSAVLAIEQRCYSHPWREKTFADCLRAGYSCYVAMQQNVVKGYFVLLLVLDEAQLLNVCVDRDLHGRGYGYGLLTQLVATAQAAGANNIFLEVRKSNSPAIRLYEKFGFIEHGVRRGYYPLDGKRREDAVLMAMYC